MIAEYLQLPFQRNGIEYKSPYMSALMDARAATGRNVETGDLIDYSKCGNWCGALAYLILIDHIGTFISKSTGANTDSRNFIKALKDFTKLTEDHCFALYALRCAFAHNYSLINEGRGTPQDAARLHHQFVVHRGDDFIILPTTPWDGKRDVSTHGVLTYVSLKKLGDCVEEIHKKLVIMASKKEIIGAGELIFIQYQASIG